MQAIARVNRVFKDKEGGLIVDYIGIASALKAAMKQYTSRDLKNYGDNDISTKAYPMFMEKLSICRDFMHGLNYILFMTGTDLDRAMLIAEGINHIVASQDEKTKFLREALALHQAQTLCLSLLDYDTRLEAAFMEAVRVAITRITQPKKLSLKEINDRINALLRQTIKDSDVINIFDGNNIEFSIFNEKYIESLAKMKQKNLAAELLARLLKDEIRFYEQTNLVKSELFSERMQRVMNMYINGQISNAEVLEELCNIAADIKADHESGALLGLTKEEKAFYDALLKPEALRDFYIDKIKSLLP